MLSLTLWGGGGTRVFWSKSRVGVSSHGGVGGRLVLTASVKWQLNQVSWRGPRGSGSHGPGILSEVLASVVTEQNPELLNGTGHACLVHHCFLGAWHLTGGAQEGVNE